jgi:uncharacterized protein YndB with AHSA1/START domain
MSKRTGVITRQGDEATLEFERKIAHPIEKVWAALTEPDQRAQWFGRTTFEPREGGSFFAVAEGPPAPETMRTVTGKVLAWAPPNVFEIEWEQAILGKTVLRYELARDGEGTILRMWHRQLTLKNAQGYIPGTHAYLDRLEALIAGEPLPSWGARYQEVASSYA